MRLAIWRQAVCGARRGVGALLGTLALLCAAANSTAAGPGARLSTAYTHARYVRLNWFNLMQYAYIALHAVAWCGVVC